MNTILVADDDQFYRDLIRRGLVKAGYSVHAVDNGEDVVKEAANGAYDALILDIYMRGLSGDRALPIVRSLCPELPVIVITGDSSISLEREIRSQGVFYYLVKPFEMNELAEVVGNSTERRAKKPKA